MMTAVVAVVMFLAVNEMQRRIALNAGRDRQDHGRLRHGRRAETKGDGQTGKSENPLHRTVLPYSAHTPYAHKDGRAWLNRR